MEAFVKAFGIEKDANTLWLLAAPGNKAMATATGQEGAMIAEFEKIIQAKQGDFARIKEILSDPAMKKAFITEMVRNMDTQKGFVKVGSRWYIDFMKLGAMAQ